MTKDGLRIVLVYAIVFAFGVFIGKTSPTWEFLIKGVLGIAALSVTFGALVWLWLRASGFSSLVDYVDHQKASFLGRSTTRELDDERRKWAARIYQERN